MAELETEQQFCLRWNNFQANITSQFEALRDDEDFVDVTLACGGQKLGAHKVVLSACSPYFKELFKSNPCRHPIIFMRDVEYGQVSSLLEFMYAGEVNIAQTELSVFLRTAEALQIRGLTDASSHHKGIQDKLNTTNKVSLTNNVQTPIISDDENEVSSDKTNRPKTSRDKSPQSKHLASEHHTIKRPIKRVNNKENDYNSTPSPSQSKKHCSNGIRITPDPEVDGSRASPTENSNGSEIELNNGTFNSIANDESKIVTDLHSEMDMPSDIQPKIELPDYGSDDDSRHEEGLFSANALLGLEMVGNLSHALSGNLNAKPGTSYSGELHEQDNGLFSSRRDRPMHRRPSHWFPLDGIGSLTDFKSPSRTHSEVLSRFVGWHETNGRGMVKLGEGIEVGEDQLRGVKWSDYRKLTRGLAAILFSPMELATCSVTGQRWSRAGTAERPVKPALDRKKVQAIISYVTTRFPTVEVSRIKQVLAYKCKENCTAFKMKAAYSDRPWLPDNH